MSKETIKVVLVDDHPMLREGTATLLVAQYDIVVAGQTGRGTDALALVSAHKPNVLILDLHLPDLGGVEVARRVRTEYPQVAILILSNYEDSGYVRALLKMGVRGYLGKTATGEEIVAAVRSAARGRATVLSDTARTAMGAGGATLSAREVQVLDLIALGRRNAEIADSLSIAESTVEYHVRQLLGKLSARSRTEALNHAREQGILPDK